MLFRARFPIFYWSGDPTELLNTKIPAGIQAVTVAIRNCLVSLGSVI